MGQRMLREEVTAADIAEVTAKWTGIPVLYMQTEHCRLGKASAMIDLVSLPGLAPVWGRYSVERVAAAAQPTLAARQLGSAATGSAAKCSIAGYTAAGLCYHDRMFHG